VRERPDGQRVRDRAHAHGAAERGARGQHRQLDPRPHDADRVPARGQPGHEAVSRAGAERGADVEAGGHAVEPDAGGQQGDARGGGVRRREEREGGLDDEPDDDDVAERPEAGPLAQRDPQQQDERADDAHPDPDADPRPAREALVEHVPRVGAEPGEQDQRGAEAVEHEAALELEVAPEEHGATVRQVDLDV
jgi:hypothetical protein